MTAPILTHQQSMAVRRVRHYGLTEGQIAILKALEAWFDENPEPPDMTFIAEQAKVSRALVQIALPVLEKLDYILVHRSKTGRVKKRGVILLMALGEKNLER